MPIMQIQDFTVEEDELNTPNYDGVNQRLQLDSDPPEGLIVHTAGFTGVGVFRIASVWDSVEDWERFRDGRLQEALKPLMEGGEGSPPSADFTYELHHFLKP